MTRTHPSRLSLAITSRLLIGQIIHMLHTEGKEQDLRQFDKARVAFLAFQRFPNQLIKHRHQIAGVLL